MNKRTTYSRMVLALLTLAALAVFSVLNLSLQPNERAKAALTRIDVSSIEPGHFKLVPHPMQLKTRHYEWQIFFYRTYAGQIRAWDVPTQNNAVALPDFFWYSPAELCLEFGPTVVDGQVDETLPIQCHRYVKPSHRVMQWNLNGETIAGHVSDMQRTQGKVEGRYFVVGLSQ